MIDNIVKQDTVMNLLLQMVRCGSWTMVYDAQNNPIEMTWDEDIRREIGWTEEELPSSFDNWAGKLHPDDVETSWAILNEFIQGGLEEYDCKFRYLTKYNGYRWYHCKARYVNTDADDNKHYIGTFVDITDEKVREEQENLRLQEERRLEAVYDMTGAARWQWKLGPDGQPYGISWDDKLMELFGYVSGDAETLSVDNWVESIAEADRPRILAAVEELNTSENYHFDQIYRMMTRQGEELWVRAIARKLFDENGNATEVIGTTVDITAQKRAQWQTEVIDSLSDEYGSVFQVDLKDETLVRVKVSGRLQDIDSDELVDPSYRVRCEAFIKLAVAEPYHEMVNEAIQEDYIRERLQRSSSYSIIYMNQLGQYCELKIARIDEDRIAMGIAEKDAEVRHYKEEEEKQRRSQEVIRGFASEYRSAFYVNLNTEEITPYNLDSVGDMNLTAAGDHEAGYSERYGKLVELFVYEGSQADMRRAGSIRNIRKELAHSKAFSTIFQTSRDELHSFYEMKIVKLDPVDAEPTEVVVGFLKKDREVLQTILVEQLKEDYLAAYYVDLNKDSSRAFEVNTEDARLKGGVDRYSAEVAAFTSRLMPEYQPIFRKIGDPARLQKMMEHSDREQIIYRFRGQEEEWLKTSIQVLDRIDGQASSALMVVSKVDNSEAHVYALNEEITRQQKELEQALKKAEAANEAKSAFLFNMSHDIRTPLNAIKGFTELAGKQDRDEEKRRDYRRKILLASEQLTAILNNVLEMARIENNKVQITEELFETDEILKSTLAIFEGEVAGKQLQLTSSVEVTHTHLYLDHTHLSEIFMNLISNAIKYTPEGGKIHVGIRELPAEEADHCFIETTIRDSGMGMPEEFVEHIFEEFSRERNSSQSGIQGTGLGMAIVKNLVDMMHGTIRIWSKLGRGTEIRVRIPHRIGEPPEEQNHSDASAISAIPEGKRILLAEDIDVNAMLVQELLSMNGLEAERARDGAECVDMLDSRESGYYDLILMDIQMPKMNGYEAAAKIRGLADPQKADIPIIALSANAFKEDQDRALAAGMNGHLAKPIDVPQMTRTLSEYL